MSKRKREIKKRKKLLEETQVEENLLVTEPVEDVEDVEVHEDPSSGASEPEEILPSESTLDDSQIVAAPAPPPARGPDPKKEVRVKQPKSQSEDSWFGQNKENFLLGLLILYVLLLGLGTIGELFEIEWILNLPLFR